MAVWVVRSRFDVRGLDLGIAPVGWDLDLTPVTTREGLEQLYRQKWPQARDAVVTSRIDQLWAFRCELAVGDLVIMPRRSGTLAVGRVTGPFRYRPDLHGPIRMTRPVEWIETDLPASALDEDLRRSLVTPEQLDVYPIRRTNGDARVLAALGGRGGTGASPVQQPALHDVVSGEAAPTPAELERYARGSIRELVEQRFPGANLLRIAAAMLRAQGFETHSVEESGTHASLVADGPAQRLYLRVAVSHGERIGPTELHEMETRMGKHGATRGMLICWAGFTPDALAEAGRFRHIALRDADAMLDAFLAQYEVLPEELRSRIPLKRIWVPAADD